MIQSLVNIVRNSGIKACEAKAKDIASRVPSSGDCLNVGGGTNQRWLWADVDDASISGVDYNTQCIRRTHDQYSLVICEQVIEHLHNTTWFLAELYKSVKIGGTLLISTENLGSWPNIFALLCGKAPFSTQAVCGEFIGGWKDGDAGYPYQNSERNSPTFSGMRGHVRVMTTGQLRYLLTKAGFIIEEEYSYAFNHYILFRCTK